MIFPFFKKNVFSGILGPPVVSVLLSASVERCFVSRMRDFWLENDNVKFGFSIVLILPIGEGMLPTRLPSLVYLIEFCGLVKIST